MRRFNGRITMTTSPLFSQAALERASPFEPLRVLTGPAGDALLAALRIKLEEVMPRRRALRAVDEQRFANSLSVLLANLLIATVNRVDAKRFVAISFNSNDYVGTALSVTVLARLRDALTALRLVEGTSGYRHVADGKVRHSRKTRLRASDALCAMFHEYEVGRGSVAWSEERDIVVLRDPKPGVGAEPSDISATRPALERMNLVLANARIELPNDAWDRVIDRYRSLIEDENDRVLSGDVSSTSLTRIFKGDWDRGGRLYGGWWINLPKVERALLAIDGEETVECDYSRLHPTLLYARLGQVLDFDIYSVPGYEGPDVRQLGKRTFNRLINKTSPGSARIFATALDREQLPLGVSFASYLNAFVGQLRPVAHWFGTGVGLSLQREDSDLALNVLSDLLDQGVLALPVHDSFIVQRRHRDRLVTVMKKCFENRYGLPIAVR